jgi:hypothetical protein
MANPNDLAKLVITRDESVRVLTVTPVGLMGPPGPCGGLLIDVSGGIIGVCGSTGINVSSPVQGTQFISLDLSDPGLVPSYTPSSHTAFTSLSADSGTARKVAFLQSDGGITFDYIRNYDVFKQSEFLLQINSFTFNVGPNILIGSSNSVYSLDGAIATASYSKSVNSATITINTANQLGFPQTLTTPFTNYTFDNQDYFSYPSINGTRVFTLTAIGDTNTATSTYTLTFVNNVYYATSSISAATVSQIISAGTTVLSNSRARTFSVTAGLGEYIYYSYPSRLGVATFTVGGFAGGFSLISTESHTNSAGYTENYYVYRSEQTGLGFTTVTVS